MANLDDIYAQSPVGSSKLDKAFPQMSAINLFGQMGQRFHNVSQDLATEVLDVSKPETVYRTHNNKTWWYQFRDSNSSPQTVFSHGSPRTINTTASCSRAPFHSLAAVSEDHGSCSNASWPYNQAVYWYDPRGHLQCYALNHPLVTGASTWFGIPEPACGPRCTQIIVYQITLDPNAEPDVWECNSTLGDVQIFSDTYYQTRADFIVSDWQARIIAGAIGWSGVTEEVWPQKYVQMSRVLGDYGPPYNVSSHATADEVATLIMKFTIGAIAAIDQLNGPRKEVAGCTPSPPLVMHVKWRPAGSILVGIPLVQLFMLFGVVWYSGKAIILEPSYLTAAHLLYPVMQKLGSRGVLMTVDEMTEAMGPDCKIKYAVRPSADDPEHYDMDFTRSLALVEEVEGFGYIRGKMPEGRYD